jgi:hypothetical protein
VLGGWGGLLLSTLMEEQLLEELKMGVSEDEGIVSDGFGGVVCVHSG